MVMSIIQQKIIISQFSNLSTNQRVHMADPAMNYVLNPFEGKLNTEYCRSTGNKIYLQATKEIDKESNKLDISISNDKYIVDHFLIQSNKYGRGSLGFMVETGVGTNNIFRQIQKIQVADIHHKSHG